MVRHLIVLVGKCQTSDCYIEPCKVQIRLLSWVVEEGYQSDLNHVCTGTGVELCSTYCLNFDWDTYVRFFRLLQRVERDGDQQQDFSCSMCMVVRPCRLFHILLARWLAVNWSTFGLLKCCACSTPTCVYLVCLSTWVPRQKITQQGDLKDSREWNG